MSTPVPRFRGVMSPVLTPFNQDLTSSPSRFVKHCRWLLKQEVGLAIFGTNSEANSLTVKEKLSLLETLLAAGLPAAKMVPGTGTCALPDTIELTRHAVEAGCAGVLMLPPFFYKGVSDEGLFRSFARVTHPRLHAAARVEQQRHADCRIVGSKFLDPPIHATVKNLEVPDREIPDKTALAVPDDGADPHEIDTGLEGDDRRCFR